MQVGTNVWVKNSNVDIFSNDLWIASTVKAMHTGPDGEAIVIVNPVNKDMKGKNEKTYIIPAGQFESEELKYRNVAQHVVTATNLNGLCFLNEPELLYALRMRYQRNALTTHLGHTLLHVNPMRATAGEERDSEDEAALEKFALDVLNHSGVAPEAWDKASAHLISLKNDISRSASVDTMIVGSGQSARPGLLVQLQGRSEGAEGHSAEGVSPKRRVLGHSIVLNGESGSGKSETAKALLRHLTKCPSDPASGAPTPVSTPGRGKEQSLGERIVQANVLLEALGNARLGRNLNSSRFGKYLELGFDAKQGLVAAQVRAFLLETVLVCRQLQDESNFHVFYQIVRGSKATERVKWGLSNEVASYHYLYQMDTAGLAHHRPPPSFQSEGRSAGVAAGGVGAAVGGRPASMASMSDDGQTASSRHSSMHEQDMSLALREEHEAQVLGQAGSPATSFRVAPVGIAAGGIAAELAGASPGAGAGTGPTAPDLMTTPAAVQQDVAGFMALKESLQALGLSAEAQVQFFNVVAGILHLGQIRFNTVTDLSGDSGVIADAHPLEQAARLLGLEQEQLETALIKKKSLVIRGEVFAKSLTASQSAVTRDATARYIYKRLFDWALQAANDSLSAAAAAAACGEAPLSSLASCVGILDIYGFENLGFNSFEQLCVNYSAEVLHKHYCESVFALELVEYQAEGLQFDQATYRRKHPLVRVLGVELMTLLDEQCRMPNPTDHKLLHKMYKKYGAAQGGVTAIGAHSKVLRMEETDYTDQLFRVAHYAGEVTYSVAGFLEKHYDEVPEAVERMLQTSTSIVLNPTAGASALGIAGAGAGSSSPPSSPMAAGTPVRTSAAPSSAANAYLASARKTPGPNKGVPPSTPATAVKRSANVNLGTLVRAQVAQLLDELEMTVPHFVRCIKASDKLAKQDVLPVAGASTNPLLKKTRRSTAGGNTTATAAAAAAAVGNAAFNPFKVLQQLRSGGILEAAHAARSHFRVKRPLRDFYLRYRGIVSADHPAHAQLPRFLPQDDAGAAAQTAADSCAALLQALPTAEAVVNALKKSGTAASAVQWQLGRSAVYLTVSDHHLLEAARFEVLEQAGAVLADHLRGFVIRMRFLRVVKGLQTIQRAMRGRQGRQEATKRRKFLRAVISLQRRHRNKAYINVAVANLRRIIRAVMVVQRAVRRYVARLTVLRLKTARERYLATSGNLLTAKELRLARRRGEVADVSLPIPPVADKMKDFRQAEHALLLEIQSMIHGTKVTNTDALVKFDVKETRRVLTDWANGSPSAELRACLLRLAGRVDVGYRLLSPDDLIPIVNAGCLMFLQTPHQRRRSSVKHAEKRVNKEHLVFRAIVKLQGVIEELLRVAFKDRKDALNRIDAIKKDLVRNIRKYGPEFSRTKATPFYAEIQRIKDFVIIADNIMRFGLVLYKYYQNYLTVMVEEYGEHSRYRKDFNDDDVYLLTLQQLMESATAPLHYSEQFLQMANPDTGMYVGAAFPLKLVDPNTFADDGSNLGSTRGRIHFHQGVYYRIKPYAPGLDFAVNSFLQFLSPHSVAPSRLLRLSGKSSDNYGQCTYYQASQGLSEYTMVDVFANPVLIEKINFTSLSAAILTSLITGAGDCRPENFMVKFVRGASAYGKVGEVEKVELLGVAADPVFERTAFAYDRIEGPYSSLAAPNVQDLLRQREQGVKDVGLGFNVLFFLPQMDEPIDPEVSRFFRSTPTIPEEVVCNWLKYLHQQNKRYDLLRLGGGFTDEDFKALKLPIKIPLGSAIRLLQRLQELREHLTSIDASRLTHHALLSFWYPKLGEFYKEWRFSSNKAHISDADLDLVPTETEEDASLLPLDTDDPADRSIQAEINQKKALSGNAKRAFFFALTPYHRLYHNAVAALEDEVSAILEDRARAAALPVNSAARSSASVKSRGGVSCLDAITETDDEDGSVDSEDGMNFPSEDRDGPDYVPGGRTPVSGSRPQSTRSGKSGQRTPGKHLSGRPQSMLIDYDNIYDEGDYGEGDDEYYAYEDAPAGLEQGPSSAAKTNRYDEKNASFYKHKAAQLAAGSSPTSPAGPQGAFNFTSPLVTMDGTYSGNGRVNLKKQVSTTSAESRPQSIRFDALYNAEDFDYEDALLDLSEAEQSVLYLRPTADGSKIPGLPLIAGARSRAPVQRNPMLGGGAHSPMVAQGTNPMSRAGASKQATPLTPPSRSNSAGAGDVWSEKPDEILGANPLAKEKKGNGAAVPESPLGQYSQEKEAQEGDTLAGGSAADGAAAPARTAAGEEEWRLEVEGQGGDGGSSVGDEGSEGSLTAATPSAIPDVALQFLMSIDFRRFDHGASRRICRVIGDALSFLDTLWLRYINEDQLRFMFEGYFEQKRHHRVATALTTTAGAMDSAAADNGDGSIEIYAVKELKLIGMTPEVFKRLQKTTTVNRLRRILGIQVSLVVIEGADDTFANVLSGESSCDTSVLSAPSAVPGSVPTAAQQQQQQPTVAVDAVPDEDSVSAGWLATPKSVTSRSHATHNAEADSDHEGDGSRPKVDFPERYADLKHRTKLVLSSYTNMVGSVPPEIIAYNSTIVKEVVRLAATVEGARTINLTMANQFGLIFLDFPGFARIGKELADRGVFNMTNRIVHRLLAHAQIERYVDVIYAILEQTPSVLLLKDRSDHFLPCDRVKALRDTKPFKYPMLAAFINAIPSINKERHAAALAKAKSASAPSATAELGEGKKQEGFQADGTATPPLRLDEDRLTGDEAFMSIYGGEEEIIVRALHFNLQTTAAEVRAKKYDLGKVDAATGEGIFHKCILCYIDEPYIYNSAIETFRLALKVLRERHITGELAQLQAEKMLFSARSFSGETPWSLAYAHNCKPMLEMIVADWLHTGEASGAPPEALALAPAVNRKGRKAAANGSASHAAQCPATPSSGPDSGATSHAPLSSEAPAEASAKHSIEAEAEADEEKSVSAEAPIQ